MREVLLFVGSAIFLTTIFAVGSLFGEKFNPLSTVYMYLASIFAGALLYWAVWRPCQGKFTLWGIPLTGRPILISVAIVVLGVLVNFTYSAFTGLGSWMIYAISFYLAGVSLLGGFAAILIRPRGRDATG